VGKVKSKIGVIKFNSGYSSKCK